MTRRCELIMTELGHYFIQVYDSFKRKKILHVIFKLKWRSIESSSNMSNLSLYYCEVPEERTFKSD